jgi:hypothetical protein
MVTLTRLIVTFICRHYNARFVLRCVFVCEVEDVLSVSLFVTQFVATFCTPLVSRSLKSAVQLGFHRFKKTDVGFKPMR